MTSADVVARALAHVMADASSQDHWIVVDEVAQNGNWIQCRIAGVYFRITVESV